jgi:hypothetical protein
MAKKSKDEVEDESLPYINGVGSYSVHPSTGKVKTKNKIGFIRPKVKQRGKKNK